MKIAWLSKGKIKMLFVARGVELFSGYCLVCLCLKCCLQVEHFTGFCSRCKCYLKFGHAQKTRFCFFNILTFVDLDVFKRLTHCVQKFEISSCFAYNEKMSFVEEIFHKFPHIFIFENSQSNSLLLFTNLLYE